MPEQLTEHDLEEFLRFAAITSAIPTTPPAPVVEDQAAGEVLHRGLVIQGDVAFVPGATLPTTWPPNRWTSITAPTRAIPTDPLRFSHLLVPEGCGITGLWVAPHPGHVVALVSIPEEARVRVTHTPGEHDDLLIGGGLWQIRVQRLEARGPDRRRKRAEQWWRYGLPVLSTKGWDGIEVAVCE